MIWKIFGALCIAAFGVYLVLFADVLTDFVSLIFGVMIVISGIGELIGYFSGKDKSSIVNGIISIIFGIIVCIHLSLLKDLFTIIVGIIMICSNIVSLYIYIGYEKEVGQKVTVNKVLSVIGIIFGVFCVALNFIIPDMVVRIIGVLLFIYGSIEVVNVFVIGKENDIENISLLNR